MCRDSFKLLETLLTFLDRLRLRFSLSTLCWEILNVGKIIPLNTI